MATLVRATMNPKLLTWAREHAGLSLTQAAKRVPVSPNLLQSWEHGLSLPTINQLRQLGRVYHRPIALFYLPSPPPISFWPASLKDFRRLPGSRIHPPSPELAYEIRRAHDRRLLALDLYRGLEEEDPPPFLLSADLSEDPETVGARIREHLGIRYDAQIRWRSEYVALSAWRSAFETAGVLVFQTTGVKIDECRGFSLTSNPFPVVVLNSQDGPHARIFTMLHELVHVMLGDGGLCDLHESGSPEASRKETFSNRAARAALVPRASFLREPNLHAIPGRRTWDDSDLADLSRKYRVSREVILNRLAALGRTTDAFCREKRNEIQKQYASRRPRSGLAEPYQKALARGGRYFVRLVLTSWGENRISANEVADDLEVRLQHLDKIQSELAEDGS